MTATAENEWDRMLRRSGQMRRYHPVGRILAPLVQLAGGYLLFFGHGEYGKPEPRWVIHIPGAKSRVGVRIEIPLSSTPDEARALLAAGVEQAFG